MAVRNETSQINVKFPQKLIDRIDSDIQSTGEFRNRSEWIIAAARYYDDYRTKIKADRKIAESENHSNIASLSGSDFSASSPENVNN